MACFAACTLSSRNGNWSSCQTPSQPLRRSVWKNSNVSTRCTEPTTMSSSQPRKLSLTSIAKSLPGVDAELGRVGRGLQPVERVPEVEQHAEVVAAGLLDGEQRPGRVREDDLVARLARLVLDHELDLRVRAAELAQRVHGVRPDVVVVDLEGVVPAVLAEPELDVVAAELEGQLRRLVEQGERLRAHRRVGVGDRALDVLAVVDLRRDRHRAEVVPGERRPDVVERAVEARERPVQVDHRQVADGAGLVDLLDQPDRVAVALRGVAVDVRREVPDAGAEDREVAHEGMCSVRVGAARELFRTVWSCTRPVKHDGTPAARRIP